MLCLDSVGGFIHLESFGYSWIALGISPGESVMGGSRQELFSTDSRSIVYGYIGGYTAF